MRLIDADALIKCIKNTADLGGWIGEALYQIKQVAIKYIDSAPSIVIEPKQGEWIAYIGMHPPEFHGKHYCSNCYHTIHLALNGGVYNYCPNCGARMKGDR